MLQVLLSLLKQTFLLLVLSRAEYLILMHKNTNIILGEIVVCCAFAACSCTRDKHGPSTAPNTPHHPLPSPHMAKANKARKWTHPTRPRQCARLWYLSPVPSRTIDGRHGPVGHRVPPALIRALVIHWVEMHTVYPLQFTEQHVMTLWMQRFFNRTRKNSDFIFNIHLLGGKEGKR